MTLEWSEMVWNDARRFMRLPYAGTLRLTDAPGASSMAAWRNVGRGGLSIESGRYFQPGRRMLVQVRPCPGGPAAELKAQVIWCRACGDKTHFHAGLKVLDDDPDVHEVLSELLLDALRRLDETPAPDIPAAENAPVLSVMTLGPVAAGF